MIADPGCARRPPPDTPDGMSEVRGLEVGLVGDLPHEAGELAGDGDRDGGAFLAAGGVEVGPAAMESELGAPGSVDRGRWLAGLAAARNQHRSRHGGALRAQHQVDWRVEGRSGASPEIRCEPFGR